MESAPVPPRERVYATTTERPGAIRPANEDPSVLVVPSARAAHLEPGEAADLRVTVENLGDAPLWAGSGVLPEPGVHLASIGWDACGGTGHRPVATEPASLSIPAGESRELRVFDPELPDGESFTEWVPGHRGLTIHYTTPALGRSTTWSEHLDWEVGDVALAPRCFETASVSMELEAARATTDRTVEMTVTVENDGARPTWVAGTVELVWSRAGDALREHGVLELGGPPRRLDPGERLVLGTGTATLPPGTGHTLEVVARSSHYGHDGAVSSPRTIEISGASGVL